MPSHLAQPWFLYAHGGAWGFGKNQLPNAWFILLSERYVA